MPNRFEASKTSSNLTSLRGGVESLRGFGLHGFLAAFYGLVLHWIVISDPDSQLAFFSAMFLLTHECFVFLARKWYTS